VIFLWEYGDNSLQDISVASKNRYGYEDFDVQNDVYHVVTSLNFTGQLELKNIETDDVLQTNDWIKPETMISVKGLIVIYDVAGMLYYPSDGEFDVLLEDNIGNSWIDYTSAAYPAQFEIQILEDAASGPYIVGVSLTNLPYGASGPPEVKKQLMIDAGLVYFDQPTPYDKLWQTQTPVGCSIKIIEPQPGSGVSGSSIEYRIANGTLKRFGQWQSQPVSGTGEILTPTLSYNFEEGPFNWIQWRAYDVIGNGPVSSQPYQVPVDTKGVTYHDFYPPSELVLLDTDVTVKITLADFGGSGVNVSTLRAAVKAAGATEYGDWFIPDFVIISQSEPVTTSLTSGPETVRLSVMIDKFSNGTENYIKFRSFDTAGNGYTESVGYQVKINTQHFLPKVTLIEPLNGSIIRTLQPTLKWQPEIPTEFDKLSYKVYLSSDRSSLEQIKNGDNITQLDDLIIIDLPGSDLELDILQSTLEPLESNTTYYWTVLPIFEQSNEGSLIGICSSGIWEFSVFLGSTGLELSADPTSVQIYAGSSDTSSIRIRNIGLEADGFTITFTHAGGIGLTLSENYVFLESEGSKLLTLTISAPAEHTGGEFTITLTAFAKNSSSEKSIDISVKVIAQQDDVDDGITEKEDDSEDNSLWMIIAIILVVVVLSILTLWNYFRKKKRGGEPEIQRPILESTEPVVELESEIEPEIPVQQARPVLIMPEEISEEAEKLPESTEPPESEVAPEPEPEQDGLGKNDEQV
jgi:hypothetical protein